MSDMGLNASIYEQLRVYADRIDCSLIKLHSNDEKKSQEARRELAELLRDIASFTTKKPELSLVAAVLREELSGTAEHFEEVLQQLADSIENDIHGMEDFKKLEDIASAIDKECLSASERMRGRA